MSVVDLMYYIQYKYEHLETIDSFKDYKEAKAALKEYQISDSTGWYYISKRACKAWYDSKLIKVS